MKLIVAIIQDQYINKVVRSLMENKIRTTRLSSTGGFLKSGNTTLLIGTEEKHIDRIVKLIKEECRSTKIKDGNDELTVGGANLFILDVDEQFKV